MATADVRRYWTALAEQGCLLCRRPAEVAHAHGGSIVERMQEPKAKGVKLDRYDWLVLPLCPTHHRTSQDEALDLIGAYAWELLFGRQDDWIDYLAAKYGRDLWALAKGEIANYDTTTGAT